QIRGVSGSILDANQHTSSTAPAASDINNIIVGGYRERSAVGDRMQQRYVDSLREETPYTTPSGETVRLPSFYDKVYTDGNGTYLLNNDALYNPNTDPTINNVNWHRIEAQR
ncbi:MAG: hypothetical protein ACK5HY_05895, partial [Parahaliea sp.]